MKNIFRTGVVILIILAVAFWHAGSLWAEGPPRPEPPTVPHYLRITSKASRIHLGSIDSFDITEGGTKAAANLLDAVEKNNPASAAVAIDIYNKIIPDENFGGEYSALQWFCEYMVAPEDKRQEFLKDPFHAYFYHYFADNDYAVLREYLKRKYHLKKIGDESTIEGQQREGILEDTILFNNPRRERWEKTTKIIEGLDLKPGDTVIDVGSGPGYYTFKFADIVGDKGRVFAADIKEEHTAYVADYAKKQGITNVTAVLSDVDSIGVEQKADLVFMCSLYHIIYTTSPERLRDDFIESIRKAMKRDGIFVVVDNALVEDTTLPYHGPYIARELIIAQLENYGFRLVKSDQFIPQRYVLTFKLAPEGVPPTLAKDSPGDCSKPECIQIASRESLAYIPNAAFPDVTPEGREAAKIFYNALLSKDKKAAMKAVNKYQELIPKEKFGDEYTAFLWFSEYLSASKQVRKKMISNRYVADYYQFLAKNDYGILKSYLKCRYNADKDGEGDRPQADLQGKALSGPAQAGKMAEPSQSADTSRLPGANNPQSGEEKAPKRPPRPPRPSEKEKAKMKPSETVSHDQMAFWRDFILFNNPYREQWEKSGEIVQTIKLKKGASIADVGSGPGYYSFKFAGIVGDQGKVYAIDTNEKHLEYVSELAKKYKIANMEVVKSRLNDVSLPPKSVDVVFLCSLYDMVYTTSMEYVKDQFIQSIKKALRKDGTLIIVDNDVLPDDQMPYHGPRIDKDLIISQLKFYGFDLVNQYQFIPQRYVLVFKMAAGGNASSS
jgi:predicted methyltransferase